MRDAITLRSMIADDLEFLYEVYASTRAEELAVTGWDDAQKEQFLRMQFNAQHQYYQGQYPDALYQVILWKDLRVGRLYVHRRTQEIGVIDIALLPAYRKQGIGSLLLREVLIEGAAANLPVRIYVERSNPALNLYERLGFRRTRDTGIYLHMEWTPPTGDALEISTCQNQ